MRHLLIMVLALSFSALCAKEKKNPILELQPIERVLLLTDVTPDIIKSLMEGRQPNLAIECQENMNIPIAFVFKTKVFSLEYNPDLTLKVQKPCYLRISNKRRCYFSEDLKNWGNPDAGCFDATISMSPDQSRAIVEIKQDDALQLR
jgi:hypothetical protein